MQIQRQGSEMFSVWQGLAGLTETRGLSPGRLPPPGSLRICAHPPGLRTAGSSWETFYFHSACSVQGAIERLAFSLIFFF